MAADTACIGEADHCVKPLPGTDVGDTLIVTYVISSDKVIVGDGKL